MRKPMTKSQLLSHLAEKAGMSKKEMSEMWDMIVGVIYEEAKESGQCLLPGLGKVVKKDRAARMGRNPATGEQIHIPAKTVLKFRVAKAAKDEILG